MQSAAIVLVFLTAVGLLYWLDVKRRPGVSGACWLVVLWAVIIGSRPVSSWFGYDLVESADSYIEGNTFERNIFLFLILAACAVLRRRNLDFRSFIRANQWLSVFYIFWAFSILWSDYPFVAFKRCFKDFGNVIMALVILTETTPQQAVRAVFARCAYLLVPLSVLFIRYWPELGRTYGGFSKNDLMYIGVCTHKNTLGNMLLVCSLFLVWDLASLPQETTELKPKQKRLVSAGLWTVLLMTVWLLHIAHSATSLLCAFLGIGIFLATKLRMVRSRFDRIEAYLLGGAFLIWVLDSIFNIRELVIVSLLGRDMSLTDRTDAWDMVLGYAENPLIGAGFKSFWSGDRMTKIWATFSGVVQAHNGYVETYLNGGLIGVMLLVGWLLTSLRRIKLGLLLDPDYGGIRLAVYTAALFYNFSEAAYNQLSLLWLALLAVLIECPGTYRKWAFAAEEQTDSHDGEFIDLRTNEQ